MKIRTIITGATGMVGEGVLFECLHNENAEQILVIGRNSCGYKRNIFFFLSLFVLTFHSPVLVQGQSQDARIDYKKLYDSIVDEYGFDQVLANGIYYEEKDRRKVGHQFFLEDQLYTGSLRYKGKEYKNIEMKFDIVDQQLILHIQDKNSEVWIVTPKDFVSTFSFSEKVFSKYEFQGESRFYQVVFDTEKLKCLYYWFKQKLESNKINYIGFNEYPDSEKECYLALDGALIKYKNNKSFTELFPKDIKNRIRNYIKSNHLNVVKSSDEKIKKLLTYCNSLL